MESGGYLRWINEVRVAGPRVDLTNSGMQTPLSDLDLDLDAMMASELVWGGEFTVREAIARRYDTALEHVLPVLGTSLGLRLVFESLVRPGDHVLIEWPTYDPLLRIPRALGAEVHTFSRDPSTDWRVNAQAVLARLTPQTKLVAFSNLHNPTARAAGEEVSSLAKELAKRGVTLLVDEVYRDFIPGALGTAHHLGDHVVAVSSLTKVYGLGSLRAGWVLANPEHVERMKDVLARLHVVDPAPLAPMVLAGLNQADALRARALIHSQKARDSIVAWGRERAWPRVVEPEGGVHVWMELPEGVASDAFCGQLLQEDSIAVVPGTMFGRPSGLRVATGVEVSQVEEGLTAIERHLQSVS